MNTSNIVKISLLAACLAIPGGMAFAACPAQDATCAGPPPPLGHKQVQPYVTPPGYNLNTNPKPSGVYQPTNHLSSDTTLVTGILGDGCYVLGDKPGDYADPAPGNGSLKVAVCKQNYVIAGKVAPSTTHTCGDTTYSVVGITCPLYPVPTIPKCGGGTEPQYIYTTREDYGNCTKTVPNPNGFMSVTEEANVSTTTSVDPTTAALMCCPIVNQTTPPSGG